MYHIEYVDVYDIIKRDISRFDMSDYSSDNAYDIPLTNKKVPGFMKDENNDAIMTEFVGFRAKMYACRRKKGYEESKRRQKKCCNEVYNVRGLHTALE